MDIRTGFYDRTTLRLFLRSKELERHGFINFRKALPDLSSTIHHLFPSSYLLPLSFSLLSSNNNSTNDS